MPAVMQRAEPHQKPMGFHWYRACKVVMLVVGILEILFYLLSSVAADKMAQMGDNSYFFLLFENFQQFLRKTNWFFFSTGLLLIITATALHRRSRLCPALVYLQNAFLPAVNLLLIPAMTNMLRNHIDAMTAILEGAADLSDSPAASGPLMVLSMMKRYITVGVPAAMGVFTAILAALLFLNSIYFYRRRNVFSRDNNS